MSLPVAAARVSAAPRFPHSFAEWRNDLVSRRIPPVVAVGGSRGKTTVVRLLDAVFTASGLRTASWTDRGVEINGRRQRGELGPWSRALARLAEGTLDVAVQELDWATVHAVGLPPAVYPAVAVTNLCVNSDSCLLQSDTQRAVRSLGRIREAVRGDGVLILNGEDFAVGSEETREAATVLVGLSPDTPLVRSHLESGGAAAWAEGNELLVGTIHAAATVGRIRELALAAGGAVGFQVHNALTAAALARACGCSPSGIARALQAYTPPPRLMPGSFNVVPVGGATVVVDRPAPSWFLRPALRALSHMPSRRHLTVVGRLEPVPDDDLLETGRLLGRGGGALILHGQAAASERSSLLRHGIASNEVPPVVIHVETERQAVARALQMLQPGDLVFVLADQPEPVLRSLDRARVRGAVA